MQHALSDARIESDGDRPCTPYTYRGNAHENPKPAREKLYSRKYYNVRPFVCKRLGAIRSKANDKNRIFENPLSRIARRQFSTLPRGVEHVVLLKTDIFQSTHRT